MAVVRYERVQNTILEIETGDSVNGMDIIALPRPKLQVVVVALVNRDRQTAITAVDSTGPFHGAVVVTFDRHSIWLLL